MKKDSLLDLVRTGQPMTGGQQLRLAASLSVPAILAQISTIVMEYIDAAMVGSLGAQASASIGLVATTTWLFGGLCSGVASGFSVQVAHRVGARDNKGARSVLRQGMTSAFLFGALLALAGACIAPFLPAWLGGEEAIRADATRYFLIFALSIPFVYFFYLSAGMLRCSGNMLVPAVLGVGACALDVVTNFFFIYPTRPLTLLGTTFTMPGLGLGVTGAALGSVAAFTLSAAVMTYFLVVRSKELRLTEERGSFLPRRDVVGRAAKIGLPMMLQHTVMCLAQILTTVIVAPLGMFAIAANSFAITAESLCYMPGYGVSDAATTLVGQSLGAGRPELMKRFAFVTVGLGMAVMTLMGVVMYLCAPLMMSLLSPVAEIQTLGTEVLRIEAWAEPMFAAAIVSYGVFVGAGDTFKPSLMNLFSMWAVRLTLAAALAPVYGLKGVWIAMCVELCFRGAIFLARLMYKAFSKRGWKAGGAAMQHQAQQQDARA
ncbi:MAG: MATE family efflux transporter [Bacteroidaceae bacterium]|nr:MATE family efflux transporter [Bacteroidaceae bacterium]